LEPLIATRERDEEIESLSGEAGRKKEDGRGEPPLKFGKKRRGSKNCR